MPEKFDNFLKVESDDSMPQEASGEFSPNEALDFVNLHKDFFEYYGHGRVKFEASPPGLETFAFDLESDTIYINSRFYKQRGFSDEKTIFATLHEVEHFLEKKTLLSEEKGEKVFESYLRRIEESQAYSLMDNCLADIRENKSVVHSTNEAYGNIETEMYKKDLFPDADFTAEPMHIQFSQALLRESRVPDQMCQVSEKVREKINQILEIKSKSGERLIDLMTNPNVPMSMRAKLQDKYVWPVVQDLLKQDLEKEKKKKDKELSDKSDKSKKQGKKSKTKKGKKPEKIKGEKQDPNQIFKEAYKRATEKMPEATPIKDIKKAFKKWQKSKRENPLEKADKEYAEKIGVKVEDLQKYRDIVKSFEKIINPENGENVIEELKKLIEKIIAKRLKPTLSPRYPVEEGEELVDPGQLVSDVKAGNLEPKVWETYEIEQKKGTQFGEVEITLVCDRSGSMEEGKKAQEQQKSAVLLMEALKYFQDRAEEEKTNLTKPLKISSEIYSFQANANDKIPLKKMSAEFGEKERVDVVGALSTCPGQRTTDFVSLEVINENLSEEDKKKILEGELKKIVIVFTDGISDDSVRVKKVLENMRKSGVVAVGVGITNEGRAALDTYAPEARLAEKAEDLARVLSDLLKDHLADV